MTEYEYADVIATYSSNAGAFFAVYLTIVSGYLITAFLAGEKLNSMQITILNFGFLVATFVITFATFGAGMTQVYYTLKLVGIAGDSPQLARTWIYSALIALMVGGVLASLYFMWNTRNTKKH